MNCLSGNKEWTDFVEEHFSGIRQPFSAGIELLPNCNFRCVHCYAESDRRAITVRPSMSTAQIKNVIDILYDHFCVDLFFTGGEVLLHPDFPDIYLYAKKKGILVSVLTNGSLINDEIADLWVEYPPELVSITMYGSSPDTYERVTGVADGYRMFCNGVKTLREHSIPFEIKIIGMKQNYGDIPAMRDFIRSYGIRNAILAWDIRPMNDGSDAPIDCRVSPQEAFAIELTDPERHEFWDKVALDRKRRTPNKRLSDGMLYPCDCAYQFVFITHDGRMQGCVKATSPSYDLLHGTFDEGWDLLGREIVQMKASKDFPCLSCDKFRYCAECTAAFVDENNDAEKPVGFYCELAELKKRYMDQRLEMVESRLEKTNE